MVHHVMAHQGTRAARRLNAGVTLIEMVVVVALMGVMAMAVAGAFVAGIDTERAIARRAEQQGQVGATEQRLTRLLMGAKLSDIAEDRTTYFQGIYSEGGSGGDLGCDRLTFTSIAPGVPLAARDSEDDFDMQHEARGPQGGLAEVSLGLTPVGDPGAERTGLFERLQRPSDGDPTQGGTETLLDEQVEQIGFRFFNGTEWVDTWDTEAAEGRRLPAAVQVSYLLRGDTSGAARSYIVPVPSSDVTTTDPVLSNPGGGAP